MALISNVFIPMESPPTALDIAANVLPLRPFVDAVQAPLHPVDPTTVPQWGALGVIVLWGVAGFACAVRTFRWNAAPGGSTRRRRAAHQSG